MFKIFENYFFIFQRQINQKLDTTLVKSLQNAKWDQIKREFGKMAVRRIFKLLSP